MNDFEVMNEMSKRGETLKMVPLENIIEISFKKDHAKVTFGLPLDAGMLIGHDLVVGGLYLMDKNVFHELTKDRK